jgi:Tol biopolymer transport system component
MPLPIPAKDASGIIRYIAEAGTPPSPAFLQLRVDALGRAKAVAKPLPVQADLGFTPVQVIPSQDEKYLVLMRFVEPLHQPYVINQSTRQVRELPAVGQFLGWHPDSRHFLFWADGLALWLVDAETLETTTLALPPQVYLQGAAISPDGLTVAYIADNLPRADGNWPGYALWLVSSAGSDAKPVFDTGSAGYLYPGAWSPDGTRIVYYGSCADSALSGPLCLWDRRTGERWSLDLPFTGFSPSWSPDGRYLAATGLTQGESPCEGEKNLSQAEREACRYARSSIYVADTLTGEVRQLTAGIAPVWSPDGSMLAFLSNRSGTPEIWTIRADGAEPQQLTMDGQPKAWQLAWYREVGK